LTHTFHAINGLEGASPVEDVKTSFRAALALDHGDAHPVLRLLQPLSAIYDAGGAETGFDDTELLFDDPDPWLRAIAKMIVAQLRLNFGHSADLAAAEMRDALDGFRAIGERWGTGFALSALGDMSAARGDFAQAVAWQREALGLVREVGVREDLPQLEVKLAHQLWLAGERAEARRMLKQARQSADEIGLTEVMASVEYGYATIAREDGALDEARDRMARTAELLDRSSFAPQFRAMAWSTRGLIEAAAGDLPAALDFHATAIEIAVTSLDSPIVALTMVGAADLASRCGDPAKAARLLGAADAIRGSRDRSVPDVDRVEAQARTALGDAGFAAAYASGGTVTIATAVEAAGLTPAA
jgi:tetratricopeptide (TPR) repeat protein